MCIKMYIYIYMYIFIEGLGFRDCVYVHMKRYTLYIYILICVGEKLVFRASE